MGDSKEDDSQEVLVPCNSDPLLIYTLWGAHGQEKLNNTNEGVECIIQGKYIEALNWGMLKLGVKLDAVSSERNDRNEGRAQRANDQFHSIQKIFDQKISEASDVIGTIGIASLMLFMQANVVGPFDMEIPESPFHVCDDMEGYHQERHQRRLGENAMSEDDAWAVDELSENGEEFVGRLYHPQYLLLATRCFERLSQNILPGNVCWSWWYLRTTFLRQKLLTARSQVLRDVLRKISAELLKEFVPSDAMDSEEREIFAALKLELVEIDFIYGYVESAEALLHEVCDLLGFQPSLTGALGTRTIHQQDPYAQLILQIECDEDAPMVSRGHLSSSALDTEVLQIATENEIQVGDKKPLSGLETESDILRAPKLIHKENNGNESVSHTELSAMQQAALLALCSLVHKKSSPDGTQRWEMTAYIESLLSQNTTEFMVRISALMEMSRLEVQRSRTRERGLVTMEALKTALTTPLPSVPPKVRSRYAFTVLGNLSRASLYKELGEAFISCGLVGAALPLFETTELWDNLVVCYQLLEKVEMAEQLVRQRLDITPDNSRLWCSLGDITNEDAYYEKAWTRSGQRSARAQRSLARSAMRSDNFEKAANHWKIALQLSPLLSEAWFSLGWCLLKIQDYKGAAEALTRLVQMEPNDGRGWNNLAMIHMKLENWQEAYIALGEATRLSRDTWQMWENYAAIATKVGEYQTAARALDHVASITQGDRVDDEIIARVISEFSKTYIPGAESPLKDLLGGTLKKIASSAKGSGMSSFWSLYAQYYSIIGESESVMECRSKQVRCLQTSTWHQDEAAFVEYSEACQALIRCYVASGSPKELSQARMLLRNTLHRAKEHFEDHASFKALGALQEHCA